MAMRQGVEAPSSSIEQVHRLRSVFQLLESREYDRVVDLIHEVQLAAERSPEELSSHVLIAANRICLACSQFRAEAERHQRSYSEAHQRENEMLTELHGILGLLSPQRESGPGELDSSLSAADPPLLRDEGRSTSSMTIDVKSAAAATSPEYHAGDIPAIRMGTEAVDYPMREEGQTTAVMSVYCLGRFRVQLNHQAVHEWSNGRGKALFKYLITHRERPVPKEVLMENFWPNASPDAARNNLNVAIHGLRKTLSRNDSSVSHILFREDCYLINPDLRIWIDTEVFLDHVTKAQALERKHRADLAIREYRKAETLYRGEFLEDDRYEDWAAPLRQELQEHYRNVLCHLSEHYLDEQELEACEAICSKLLVVDGCDEASHRHLMRCYSRRGRVNRALRQFDLCVDALKRELDVMPSHPTVELKERIRHRQSV